MHANSRDTPGTVVLISHVMRIYYHTSVWLIVNKFVIVIYVKFISVYVFGINSVNAIILGL